VAIGIGIVLSLLLTELILRLHNPFETRLRGDRIVLPVARQYRFQNPDVQGLDSVIVHTKNSIGFRGPDPPASGFDGDFVVFVVGGSTTECMYLSDGKDWPTLLGDSLRTVIDSLWINNAGLDGHSTFGHRILLQDVILPYHPDMIVFLLGVNDVGRSDLHAQMAAHLKAGMRFDSLEGLIKSLAAYSETASLTLNLYRYLRAAARGLPHKRVDLQGMPHAIPSAAAIDSAVSVHQRLYIAAYRERIATLVDMCRSAGVTPLLLTQPMLLGSGRDPVTGIDLETVVVAGQTGRERWLVLEAYNDVVREFQNDAGVVVVDLARSMDKSSAYYYDILHFTERGAAEVARIVFAGIVREGRPRLQ